MAAMLLFTAAGCGGDKKADGDRVTAAKDILRVGVPGFADSLDPADRCNSWAVMRYGIGETLVRFDQKMNPVPWLAESWKMNDDRLTWIFKISDKAVFSNGNKVTGDAVAKSLLRTFEKSPRAKTMFQYDSIAGEGQNVIIRTMKPVPTLPGILGDPMFLIVDTSVKDRDYAVKGPVGTGPYVVTSFVKGKAALAANERYWNGKVSVKKLEISPIDDANTRALALRKGEIDVAVGVASGDMALFKDTTKYRISETDSFLDTLALISVREGKPLADKRIREALVSSLNRQSYCKVLLRDTFIPGGPLMPPSAGYGYDELIKLDKNRYNVERAKKLLAEAGWKDTNGDGIVDKGGKSLEINLIFCSNLAELPLFAEATRSDAGRIGIRINLKNVDDNELNKIRATGDYDLLLSDVAAEQAGDPAVFLNMYWKTNRDGCNSTNSSGYSNPKYDELSDRLAVEFDTNKRRQLVIDMQKIILEDCAAIIFGHPRTNIISGTAIVNAEVQPCDYYWVTGDWTSATMK